MRFLVMVFAVLALLPLVVLAHDLYLAYLAAEEAHMSFGEKPVKFSDLGWLWVQYSPETYDWARGTVDPQMWRGMIDPVLQQTALVITAVPAALMALALIILKVLRMFPSLLRFRAGRLPKKEKGSIAIKGTDKSKGRFSYKRK